MRRLPGHIGGYLWNEIISERVLFIHWADKEKNKGGKAGLICVIGILNKFLVFFQAGSARCIAVGGLVIKHVCYRHAVFQCKAGLSERLNFHILHHIDNDSGHDLRQFHAADFLVRGNAHGFRYLFQVTSAAELCCMDHRCGQ